MELNINDSIVYAMNNDTGEWLELGKADFNFVHPIQLYPELNNECHVYKDGVMEFTASFRIQLKDTLKIWGLTNNSIRLHGGKAIRTVPKRFLK